jgi:hypothetical protein
MFITGSLLSFSVPQTPHFKSHVALVGPHGDEENRFRSCNKQTSNIKLSAEGLDERLQLAPSLSAFERLSRMSKRYKQFRLRNGGMTSKR